MKLERIIDIQLPYDKRHSDPCKDYGIGSMAIWMILKGKKGAVQAMFNTDIYPEKNMRKDCKKQVRCVSVGYHSKKPSYRGQSSMKCSLFGKCYYSYSLFRGDELGLDRMFLRGDKDGIWNSLENEYIDLFVK